jgi:hypothetical protein
MADGGDGDCCKCCCSFIFTSGLTALFMWLSLRTYKPTCSIERFYVPPLNLSGNSTANRNNRTIDFDLKLKNGMKDKGVHYATINLTFSYILNNSRQPIANYTLPEFYQGHEKKANRKQLVRNISLMPWDAAIDMVSNGSTVTFRVDLATRVKFKIMFWFTKRKSLVVGGDVVVDNSGGMKKKKKGIKLKSGAPDLESHWVRVGPLVAFTSFLILCF